ncbi:MAG TPA: carboxylesterase family protein [Steroidobacteraceae bacterium]|jgi:para-nitrobenzyl esterase
MSEDVVLEIEPGRIRGAVNQGVANFKGIPYGSGVDGAGRWRRAKPVSSWSGVRDTRAYGPRAIQVEHRDIGITSDELEELLLLGEPENDHWKVQSEDCLTLNVWSSSLERNTKHPVMFWCHGGGYYGECPPVWWFDGENLARDGQVVVVTVRHRLGTLGYLHLADLPGAVAYEDSGNIGMLDLVDALRWVRNNIERFGGDPDNVTIFGESGGGGKVSVLMAMPEAKGLFHKAIIQSGPHLRSPSREEATETATALLAELGLSPNDVDKLARISSECLVAAQKNC